MEKIHAIQIQWECQQLLNRAVTLTDEQQWEALSKCYTDDAVMFRPSDSENAITGRQEIKASFVARPPRITCHLLANCVFTIVDSITVAATSRVLLMAGDSTATHPAIADSKILTGKFNDTITLVNDEWLLARREGSIDLRYDYQ